MLNQLQSIKKLKPDLNIKIIITTTKQFRKQKMQKTDFEKSLDDRIFTHIELNGLQINDVRKLLGSKFNAEEAEALFQQTDGNPLLLKTISEFNDDKIEELKNLPLDERSMLALIFAQDILNNKQM
jgi:hypothetical protein